MTFSPSSVLVAGLLSMPAAAAFAQATQDAAPKSTQAPPTDIKRPGTLSDKLGETNGVIHPTGDIDPDIRKPAPVEHPNSTPVIPPPGTGGRPGAVPK